MKKVSTVGWSLSILFLASVILVIVFGIELRVINYFFWFSLGLFIGFNMCFYVIKRKY